MKFLYIAFLAGGLALGTAGCDPDDPIPPGEGGTSGELGGMGGEGNDDTDCDAEHPCEMGEVCTDGECVLPPDGCICPEIHAPVCGADGETYGNACQANCADIEVVHDGECEEACFCPAVFDPVCGVDGETYSNACSANCAHVAVEHDGSCEFGCAPEDMIDGECRVACDDVTGCEGDFACQFELCADVICDPGEEGCASCWGHCLPVEPACPEENDPNVEYVSHNVDQCAVIRFVCAPGQEAFSDDCGCGCIGEPVIECGVGEILIDGTCEQSCMGGNECADGQMCNAGEVCLPPPGCEEGQACPAVCTGWCVGNPEPPICDRGDVLVDGVCVHTCFEDANCAEGQICNLNWANCPEGVACRPAFAGICEDAPVECHAGQILVNGECLQLCGGDADCQNGQICGDLPGIGCPEGAACIIAAPMVCLDPPSPCGPEEYEANGMCEAICYSDDECGFGQTCNADDVCIAPENCFNDMPCFERCGGWCVGDIIEPPMECDPSQIMVNDECLQMCTINDECVDGQICAELPGIGCPEGASCIIPVITVCQDAPVPECGPGELLIDNVCETTCFDDNACGAGEQCVVDECVNPPRECPPGVACLVACMGICEAVPAVECNEVSFLINGVCEQACYGDQDCGDFVCNATEVCMAPPGCQAGEPCPAVCAGWCTGEEIHPAE